MARRFLPKVNMARLCDMHRKEKDPKAQSRLVVCIQRKQGKTIAEISKGLNIPRSTVTNWIRNIEKNGLNKRCDIKNKGAACKLTKRQIKALERDLEAGPAAIGLGSGAWTIPLIRTHIKKKFSVEYHVHSVWDLVNRLGFVYIKPRPATYGGRLRQKSRISKKSSQNRSNLRWARASGRFL